MYVYVVSEMNMYFLAVISSLYVLDFIQSEMDFRKALHDPIRNKNRIELFVSLFKNYHANIKSIKVIEVPIYLTRIYYNYDNLFDSGLLYLMHIPILVAIYFVRILPL